MPKKLTPMIQESNRHKIQVKLSSEFSHPSSISHFDFRHEWRCHLFAIDSKSFDITRKVSRAETWYNGWKEVETWWQGLASVKRNGVDSTLWRKSRKQRGTLSGDGNSTTITFEFFFSRNLKQIWLLLQYHYMCKERGKQL